ncbi:Os07g0230400, partial [Oryza sativa Japonica Group]
SGRRSQGGRVSGVGAGPDGSAKGAGSGGSSFSLPVGTLTLPRAPPLLCGEFLGWIEGPACQRGKLRLPKQCHLVQCSPSARSSEEAGGWWNGRVLGQLSAMVV